MNTATAHVAPRRIDVLSDGLTLTLRLDADQPARIVALGRPDGESLLLPHPIVEVLTAGERHDRMTLGYVGTAVGARLRVTRVEQDTGSTTIDQRDPRSGLVVRTRIEPNGDGFRVRHEARNDGDHDVVLFALPSLSVRMAAEPDELVLVSGRSEWLGEGRWTRSAMSSLLPDLGFARVNQPDRTGFGQSSSGGWSTGSALPTAALVSERGTAVAWQIESSAGWQWSLSRGDGGVVLSAGGPTEREHQAEVRLRPGETADGVAAGLVASYDGQDAVFAALTRLRRSLRAPRPQDEALPVVYNDYMNTLMGQPTTEALLPLIAAAAGVGAEYFCIDAGWFADDTDYWSSIGEWQDSSTRFTGGLGRVVDAIRAEGMRPGIWIEPEAVGLDSPIAERLPPEAFFQRYGEPVVQQRRKHLDLRHPAARDHLDAVVDRLVSQHGIAYLKLDYNIEPGSGTDLGGTSPGQGLLAHTRALRSWLEDVQVRHPHLLIENCASGAMRSDYHLLAVTHLQSTSDQQDALRYAAIAASAPASILPEQSGNWAYPSADMSRGELALTLVSGLSGRLYLAGFLDRLPAEASALVAEAVRFAKDHRSELATAVPFWPLGLPDWQDEVIAVGLRRLDGSALVFVWSRGRGREIELTGAATQLFPAGGAWRTRGNTVVVPDGPDAAVFELASD